MTLSAILAAIACGFLGMAVGAALQRWGDGVRASEHLGPRKPYAALASLWERSS